MWQGANRIQADTVDLDREKRMLVAEATWSRICGRSRRTTKRRRNGRR